MQGQYEDSETGLYYNRYRYFDPNICAYISQDPIRLNAGTNLYFYGLNSVMWIDPLGLGCENIVSDTQGSTVDVELKYKEGWTPEQKIYADQKVKALTEANTVKTNPKRSGSASKKYKNVYGDNSIPEKHDIDHTIDLQLGGIDDVTNMNPLDLSVNRSLGSQIYNQIKNYPIGTKFGKFTIS